MAREGTRRRGKNQPASSDPANTITSIATNNSSIDDCNEGRTSREAYPTSGLSAPQKISLEAKRVQLTDCSSNYDHQTVCRYTDEIMRSFDPKDAADHLLIKDVITMEHVATKYMKEALDMGWPVQMRNEYLKLAMKAIDLKQKLIATLDKRHRNNDQNIFVRHLHVEPGAKAMVGNFNAEASAGSKPDQSEKISHLELKPPNAPNEQVPLASSKKESK